MFRPLAILAATATIATASPALADTAFETVRSEKPVAETMDALEAAVTDAGATVFARVDHGAGAASAGLELAEAELLIFGNPQLGTPAMQADIRAGLLLPLRVLVHAEGEGSVIVWQDVEDMFDGLDIDDDAEFITKMETALEALTAKAVE